MFEQSPVSNRLALEVVSASRGLESYSSHVKQAARNGTDLLHFLE